MIKPEVKKGDHITLTLTSWGRLGEAMAQHEDLDVFVLGGIPGETVTAEILRIYRRYMTAQVVQVIDRSEYRTDPPCPYYGDCTGCQWQHVKYSEQLNSKHRRVSDALGRIAGLFNQNIHPVIPSPNEYEYRNHARFTVGPSGSLGFVNRETRQFVKIDSCMLMHKKINDILGQLQGHCIETTQLAIRAGKYTGDFLIQPTLKNPQISVVTGQKHYLESVGTTSFQVASPSFFQVNVEQAAQIINILRQTLNLRGDEILVDAYAGVGTLAILLAPFVKTVLAIEESSAAIKDAHLNASTVTNISFLEGKTEEVLFKLEYVPDVVVLDPPRKGCEANALASLINIRPPRIAYVSCDPDSLARDLKILVEGGYSLQQIQPLDMFPQTHHIECIASLTYDQITPKIILASGSPRRLDLLSQMNLNFQVISSDIPEYHLENESAEEMTRRLSFEKASAVSQYVTEGYVIGADSTVVWQDLPIGKPTDIDDARRMLRELRGTKHEVTTGVTIIEAKSGRHITDSMTSNITLREYSDQEIEESIARGTPMDKAGAYAIQDELFKPGEMTNGCYTNVIGLPLCRLNEMFTKFGVELPTGPNIESTINCRIQCPFQGNSKL